VNKKKIFFLLTISIVILLLVFLTPYCFYRQHFKYVFDDRISFSATQNYLNVSKKLEKNGSVDPAALVDLLPGIASIIIQQNTCTQKQLFFYAKEPVILLNDSLVLTADGTLVQKNDYQEHYLSTLPSILVNQSLLASKQLPKDFLSFFLKIDEQYLKIYRWTVHSKHRIAVVIPDVDIEILFTTMSSSPNALLERCIRLHEMIKHERLGKKNIYDARFDNQIIVQ
jgi:hypothetical protein